MNSDSNSKLSLFHLLFAVGLTATPTIGFVVGGNQFGWTGSLDGLIIGVPVGALIGYAPHWLAGKVLSFIEDDLPNDTHPHYKMADDFDENSSRDRDEDH